MKKQYFQRHIFWEIGGQSGSGGNFRTGKITPVGRARYMVVVEVPPRRPVPDTVLVIAVGFPPHFKVSFGTKEDSSVPPERVAGELTYCGIRQVDDIGTGLRSVSPYRGSRCRIVIQETPETVSYTHLDVYKRQH